MADRDRDERELELGEPGSIDRSQVEQELERERGDVRWPGPRDDPEHEPDEPWARRK